MERPEYAERPEHRERPVVDIERVAEEGRFGCPMLIGTQLSLDDPPRYVFRCHNGWALRSHLEAARCMVTEHQNLCWQANPERIPEIDDEARTLAAVAEESMSSRL